MTRSTAFALATLLALATAPAALCGQTLTDPAVAAIFDQANTADIETGRLAAARAGNAEVREMGRMFADAHTAVRQQGRDLLQKLGVTPMLPAGDRGAEQLRATLADLSGRKGKDFDRAYLDHEIAFHQAVIDAVTTTLLPAITNPELKALVEKVAPAFVAHLEQAKNLRKKVG